MSDLLRRSAVLGLAITSLCTAPRLHGDEALLSGISDKPNSPLTFTAKELTLLERRFGVHGPQHGLVQLMTPAWISWSRCAATPWRSCANSNR